MRIVSGIVFTLLLAGMLTLAFNIRPVKASGTIYIRADGSVDPDTAPISTVDNVTYTFLGNIYVEIVVEKNNTVLDGAGYSVQGAWDLHRGISLYGGSNVTIKNIEIRAFMYGLYLQHSSNNTISGNNITENGFGINLVDSSDNTINGNNITINYGVGIEFDFSSNNTINGNNITNNDVGILVYLSSFDNAIYHNNFIGNTQQVEIPTSEQANFWDDGYPSGGNYWSDYAGVDLDHDGIGDTAHEIDADNIDHNPLMGMFHSFNTSLGKPVNVISNSTVEDFQYFELNNTIKLYVSNVTGNQTHGFCRACIPHELMNVTSISVIIDDGATTTLHPNYTLHDNGTHRWIYFAYQHSTHKIDIIPEFPSLIILPLFMTATLLAVIVYSKKTDKSQKLQCPHRN